VLLYEKACGMFSEAFMRASNDDDGGSCFENQLKNASFSPFQELAERIASLNPELVGEQ
jgi:hypothetical protein